MGSLQLNQGGNTLNPTMYIEVAALLEMLLGLDRLDRQDSCSALGSLSWVQLYELGSKLCHPKLCALQLGLKGKNRW